MRRSAWDLLGRFTNIFEHRGCIRKVAPNLRNVVPERVQQGGLKSQILVLFESWKHAEQNKNMYQKSSAEFEERGPKKGPTGRPEIADPSAV